MTLFPYPNTKRLMNRVLALLSGLVVAILIGCEKKAAAPVAPPPTVTVAPIGQEDVMVRNTWVGLLNGYQNADIRAQVTGYLTAQDYKEGSLVKKGDVLFTIDKRPFEAALAQAQADYAKAVVCCPTRPNNPRSPNATLSDQSDQSAGV